MKMSKKKGKSGIAIVLTLLILAGLFTGCVIADRNTRRIGFGDTTPMVSKYTGQGDRRGVSFYLMGSHYVVDATPLFETARFLAQGVEAVLDAACDVGDAWSGQFKPKGW